jgi:UDP-4-amino-4-deoxy-L-arabinose formyltransferase/UDP-glucuronic acid dehydrogenase (UDP-4-keto-hexauronic acid decarboxylating)
MAQRLRILLIAEEAAGVQTLRLLTGSPHQVVAVMTGGGGGMASGLTMEGVASRLGVPVWPVRRGREKSFAETMRQEEVDLLLNVHALCVLPGELVATPRLGSFNLHPGPLPRYAGLNAPSWAIYHGERSHAVTVHWMDAGIDTGAIAYETELTIDDQDTGFTLSAKCVRAGIPLLQQLLDAAAEGAVPRRPQPAQPRRYHGREVPQQGRLLWTVPAAQVVNFVRACDYLPFASPWGHPAASIGGRELLVLKAVGTGEPCTAAPGTVGQYVGSDVLVAAADEWVRVRRVRVGKSALPAAEVLQPGDRFDLPAKSEEALSATP